MNGAFEYSLPIMSGGNFSCGVNSVATFQNKCLFCIHKTVAFVLEDFSSVVNNIGIDSFSPCRFSDVVESNAF